MLLHDPVTYNGCKNVLFEAVKLHVTIHLPIGACADASQKHPLFVRKNLIVDDPDIRGEYRMTIDFLVGGASPLMGQQYTAEAVIKASLEGAVHLQNTTGLGI